MRDYRNIKAWAKSHELVKSVYAATNSFPQDERYGVTSQIRRAAVSIACNIVEGSKKISKRDFARFINISEGSAAEVEYLVLLSSDLGYLDAASFDSLNVKTSEVLKILYGLRGSVENEARLDEKAKT